MCVGINIYLYLIKFFGFRIDDKMLKRVGLDYWEFVNIMYYDSIEVFFEVINGEYYLLIKFGKKIYSDFDFLNYDKDFYFIFGKEMIGLLDWVKEKY